jgi:hypothetical protein
VSIAIRAYSTSLGSMANLPNDGNLFGNDDREGMALSRARWENFQRENQQILHENQQTLRDI